jgi:ketosteroid isomerase-like protein
MDAAANKRLIETYFDKIAKGDPTLPEMLADDVVWWVPPGSDMAGTYRGKPAVLEMMGKGIGLYSPTEPMRISVEKIVAEGDDVCVQFVLEATTAKGRRYRNHYHFAFALRGGKISSVKEYVDTKYAHDVLFS